MLTMLSKLASIAPFAAIGGAVAAETTHPGEVTGYQVLIWVGCAYLIMAFMIRSREFWDRFVRPHPDPASTYATLAEVKRVAEAVERCATADDLADAVDRIEAAVRDLRSETDRRMTAAKESREKMHGEIADLRTHAAGMSAKLDNLSQQNALEALKDSLHRKP